MEDDTKKKHSYFTQWLKGSEFKNSFDMQNIHSNSVNSMFTMKGGFQLAVTSMGGVKKGCAFKTKLWTV